MGYPWLWYVVATVLEEPVVTFVLVSLTIWTYLISYCQKPRMCKSSVKLCQRIPAWWAYNDKNIASHGPSVLVYDFTHLFPHYYQSYLMAGDRFIIFNRIWATFETWVQFKGYLFMVPPRNLKYFVILNPINPIQYNTIQYNTIKGTWKFCVPWGLQFHCTTTIGVDPRSGTADWATALQAGR
jgi:hypothetical protein